MFDPADHDVVAAREHDERPLEIRGPGDEAEALVRAASPGRLLLRIGLPAALLAAAAVVVWQGREWLAERKARGVPVARIGAVTTRIGCGCRGPEEQPEHEVALGPYEIDLHEVTVGDYAACVRRGRCSAPRKGETCAWGKEGLDAHPVDCVDHGQAARYCAWVGKRLPTEKEWEHAARGTDGRRYPWGLERPAPSLLNVCGTECQRFGAERGRALPAMYERADPFPLTAPVGSFPAGRSPYGLFDMEGNVREWTASGFCPYPVEQCGDTLAFVVRGAGWSSHVEAKVEVTAREAVGRDEGQEALGFRCARSR